MNFKKIPKKKVFVYVVKQMLPATPGVAQAESEADNSGLDVRAKARGRSGDWASLDCRCLRPGLCRGCGRARPCSPQIRTGNCHKSLRLLAPL